MPDQPESGVLVIDKPAGLTSHQVVAHVRRLLGTRKVGHAGTLDPMATGVLIIGVGKATRLLGYLSRTDKAYEATIRLGIGTVTDDAEGDVVSATGAADLRDADIEEAIGEAAGRDPPSAVSGVGDQDQRRAIVCTRAGPDGTSNSRPGRSGSHGLRFVPRELMRLPESRFSTWTSRWSARQVPMCGHSPVTSEPPSVWAVI